MRNRFFSDGGTLNYTVDKFESGLRLLRTQLTLATVATDRCLTLLVFHQSAGCWYSSIGHLVDIVDVPVDEVFAARCLLLVDRGQLLGYFISQTLLAWLLLSEPRVSASQWG